MELSKQEMELFLQLQWSKNLFYKMFHIFLGVWNSFSKHEKELYKQKLEIILDSFGPILANRELSGAIWTHLNLFWPTWTHLVPFGLIWTNLDQFWPIWTNLVQFGPIGPIWNNLDSFSFSYSQEMIASIIQKRKRSSLRKICYTIRYYNSPGSDLTTLLDNKLHGSWVRTIYIVILDNGHKALLLVLLVC